VTRIEDEAGIGYWDALIVATASKAGALRILSEDLNPGQIRPVASLLLSQDFRGQMRMIRNGLISLINYRAHERPRLS